MVELKDADLIREAQSGNVAAVGILYDRHHETIYRYIWLRVKNKKQAEDMTGDVFTSMVSSLADYQVTKVPFRGWLYRIAHNRVVDYYRRSNTHRTMPIEYAEPLTMSETRSNPAVIVEKQLTTERVQEALTRIDPAQQEVVILRFLVGLPLSEVAQTVDKSVAAVKSLQHRGLKALRAALLLM